MAVASNVVRDTVIALLVAIATTAGLIALTPWPWVITVPASVLLGAGVLLMDLLIFRRHQTAGIPGIRGMLAALAVITLFASMALAFGLGHEIGASDEQSYPFVARGDVTSVGQVFGGPGESYPWISNVAPGRQVEIECHVLDGGTPWYRVAHGIHGGGWVNAQQFAPAPHTGRGSPPRCPE